MEVILDDLKNHPHCPHGPCLLFERYSSDGSKTGRKFYACSACRDRSECPYFQWADEDISEKRKALWEKLIKEKRPPFTHEEYMKRLESFKLLPRNKRKYCKTCSLLILDQPQKHSNHDILDNISSEHMLNPSSLFQAFYNKKVEAQYFFNKTTIDFFVSLIKDLGFSKVVLIGVPKIHEVLIQNQDSNLSSFFMDIDHRYMQFFSPEQFCHYNMFNNYFFSGKESKKLFKKFLCENEDQKVLLIIDPPFGGLIDAIAFTLKKINKWWQRKNNKTDFIPLMWIFPYFHEARILKNLPGVKMMDYKVEYDNHKKFGKSKSPVRIFTNIEASHFILPSEYGYKFCDKCQRYVSEENKHCSKCNACTTKHGKTYHHCDYCQHCVKSSHIHCQKCNKCDLRSSKSAEMCHKCECRNTENGQDVLEKCFKCKSVGHRKQNCPGGFKHIKKKMKKS